MNSEDLENQNYHTRVSARRGVVRSNGSALSALGRSVRESHSIRPSEASKCAAEQSDFDDAAGCPEAVARSTAAIAPQVSVTPTMPITSAR